jgi:uncharacterized protein YbaP (TraB family)
MHASIRYWILGLGLELLLAGVACAAPPQPPLWKVTKGQSTVYLLGSMHFLRDSDYPMSAEVDTAYKEADRLIFELPPSDMASPAAAVTMMQFGTYHDSGHVLQNDVSPDLWNKIIAYGSKNGLPEVAVQKFEPWFMAMMMIGLEGEKIGLKPESGLDMHFASLAATDHKAVSGFETVEQQAVIFHNAPTKVQVEMLRQGFDELPDFGKDMEQEHDQWRSGDVDGMLAEAKKEFADYPDLYRTLLADRNRNWVPQIEKLLDGGKHGTLVIVGALHLAGTNGVANLLRKDGYEVERICTRCTDLH